MNSELHEKGMTRRGFLKRSLVVGSVAWAVPVVVDLGTLPTARAFSGGSGPQDPPDDPPETRTEDPPQARVKASTLRAPGSNAAPAVQAAQAETLPETGVPADTLAAASVGLIGLGALAAKHAKSAERRKGDGSRVAES